MTDKNPYKKNEALCILMLLSLVFTLGKRLRLT